MYKKFLEALELFMKYQPEGTRFPFHADHDTIYIKYVAEDALSDKEQALVEEAGFWFDSENEGRWARSCYR